MGDTDSIGMVTNNCLSFVERTRTMAEEKKLSADEIMKLVNNAGLSIEGLRKFAAECGGCFSGCPSGCFSSCTTCASGKSSGHGHTIMAHPQEEILATIIE